MVPDRVQYLVASEERVRLLEALTEGPARQCTLRRKCSLARSTVHRNLTGCAERGWVVETSEGYALTQAGERVVAAYREFAETVYTLADHDPVLQHVGDAHEPLPTAALENCQTTTADATNPHAPSIAAAEVIRRNAGDPIRIAVGGVSPITNDAGWDAVEAGSRVESVVDESVLETLQRAYESTVEAAVDRDRVDIRLSPTSIDTGVVLAGDEVCVVVQDDDGTTQAALTGANRALQEWAEAAYERVREGTTVVEPGAATVEAGP